MGGPYDNACSLLTTSCPIMGKGDGPLAWLWRRPLNPTGTPAGPWRRTGYSCKQHPPAEKLTLADVRRAFRQVPFAKPHLTTQPNGWTLVNLDTYYTTTWPQRGIEPDETTHVHLLGHDVAIRPRLVRYHYDYGDGHSENTTDPGGPYPHGTVRHPYRTRGTATITITARYTADFAIDHGPYRHLDDTIDIPGPASPITIYEARAQLVPTTDE